MSKRTNSVLITVALLGLVFRPLGAQRARNPVPASLSPYLVALSVANLDSTSTWYRTLLGFRVMRAAYEPAPGLRIAFLVRNDFRLELIEMAHSRARRLALPDTSRDISLQGFTKLAFRVTDIEAAVANFRRHGVHFVFGPATDSTFRTRHVIVADPDGNLVQLFQPYGR